MFYEIFHVGQHVATVVASSETSARIRGARRAKVADWREILAYESTSNRLTTKDGQLRIK